MTVVEFGDVEVRIRDHLTELVFEFSSQHLVVTVADEHGVDRYGFGGEAAYNEVMSLADFWRDFESLIIFDGSLAMRVGIYTNTFYVLRPKTGDPVVIDGFLDVGSRYARSFWIGVPFGRYSEFVGRMKVVTETWLLDYWAAQGFEE